MEVKNSPMMDQLLVNTAAQAPANQTAKAAKDADRPDFDSMVNQKRTGKGEPKASTTAKPNEKPEAAQPETEEAVNGEQYAAAAAMLFQPQPELRIEPMAEEPAIVGELAVETVQAAEPEIPVVQAEAPEAQNVPVAETSMEETAETVQTSVRQTPAQPTAEAKTEAKPVDAETPAEAKPEAKPEERVERPVAQTQNAPREETEAPRAERTPVQRIVRNEARAEDEGEDNAQTAQAAPLFERVDAPVVKVAEAPRPVPLEAKDGAEQLGREIDGILVNNADANRIEVTLTPDALGKLTVEITRNEHGVLNIVLHPSTERAASLLERSTGDLQHAMMSNGRSDVQVQVRPAGESQQQFLNPDGQNGQNRQQQQQQGRRQEQRSAQDFLQQLRLGLVDVDDSEQ